VLDNLSQNQRMILAIVLSLVVLVGYDYFFIPKTKQNLQTMELNNSSKNSKETSNRVSGVSAPASNISSSGSGAAPSTVKEKLKQKIIATVSSKHYTANIDEFGRIVQFTVNDKKFENEKGEGLKLFDEKSEPKILEVRFSDATLNDEAFKVPYTADTKELKIEDKAKILVLTQHLSGIVVTKKITFFPKGNYDIEVSLSKKSEFYITPGHRPAVIADAYTVHGVLVENPDDTLKIVKDADCEKSEIVNGAKIVSAFDRYYTTAFYNFDKGLNAVISPDSQKDPMVFVRGDKELKFSGFIGPKDHKLLSSIDPRLTDIIEYGFFTFIAKPMFLLLQFLHNLIGNWGWAIVIITILIRVVLFPLTLKGMVSMSKMKELAPKMKELQKKYKDDKQKLNAHMMELYKKHGANPMGGCLPMILQIPVFFAIYRVLLNAIELKAAPWMLWISDLSLKDPYFILPILMGATMFWNQRVTPTTITDPMQEKIMKWLPLVFTFFFVTFPAGLTLYWFTNNLLSVAQQYYVNYYLEKKKKEQKVGK